MFRIFRSEWYETKLKKLSNLEIERVSKFEQSLKESPFGGKPLGYSFLREKKFDGKRLIFLVYEKHKCIFLVTITNKKMQQEVIDLIKANLDVYKENIEKLIKDL